jgi:hypothetical protein
MFHRHEGDSNSQLLVVIKAQIAQVVVNQIISYLILKKGPKLRNLAYLKDI